MRNLRNVQRTIKKFVDNELSLSASAWDPDSGDLICAYGPAANDATIQLHRLVFDNGVFGSQKLIASWNAPSPNPAFAHDRILNLSYSPDNRSHCLVLAGGDIVLVREEPDAANERIEIVGSVDDGITAARWSPDEEILALTTSTQSVLLMSRDLDPLADIKMTVEDMKASNHVSVGWGKAETQFKGKRAKALRDPTVPEKVDEGLLSDSDDGKATISWRGDGECFAVNSVESQKHRMIRVYTREGTLESVSQPVDFLEGALSWRPAGNLIAGVKRERDQAEVVFFERNGLRHGQFALRVSRSDLETWASNIDVEWNADSTVLAVIFTDRVQLWTMGNYHYYLKQTMWLSSEDSSSPKVLWSVENPLLVACHSANLLSINRFVFTVRHGSTVAPHDLGTVGVLDGSTYINSLSMNNTYDDTELLKLTSFRFANVPPPMCQFEVVLTDDAVDVAINSTAGTLAVLCRKAVHLYKYSTKKKSARAPELIETLDLPISGNDWLQVELSNDGHLLVLGYNIENGECLLGCALSTGKQKFDHVDLDSGNKNIVTLFSTLHGDSIFAAAYSGHLRSLNQSASLQMQTQTSLSTAQSCPWVTVATIGDRSVAFGLSYNGSLFANDRLLAHNCTSFIVTISHLILTTSQHYLKFVHLNNPDDFDIPRDEPEVDERCRSIERGAKIVVAMPSIYALVLQMPRGNLETIYPRAMVLAGIRNDIDASQYQSAFLHCRAHRVDMNIIHDHDSDTFMMNINNFITQVARVDHIDLFLSQLRNEDVSETMYRDTIHKSTSGKAVTPKQPQSPSTSKINRICDAFLQVLDSKAETHLQNTITAYVCKSPPDLDGGLKIISQLKEQGEDLAEKAAEHICFLADVNRLFDHALGIYDLDVALLIAQNSQKDPREYLPYVQSLQEMPQLRKQFTIDNDLGRQAKALSHLFALDSFEELEVYTQKHELYSAAVELYKYQPERLRRLMRLHADFLESRNRYKEAALAYEFLGDFGASMPAYRAANMWRETMSSAALIPLDDEGIMAIARELIEGLEESKEHEAVATLYLDYLSDVDQAAEHLCKASQFSDAIRLVAKYQRLDLLKTTIDTGLAERFTSTIELLSECREQIKAQTGRLRDLRIKKEQEPLAFYAGEHSSATNGDIPDDISLASTNASTSGGTFMTRYTNRSDGTINTQTTHKTSKNRKREERKRARGKKGTIYEEEYLVNSLTRLVDRINSINEDTSRLVDALIRRAKREEAMVVQKAMLEVIQHCEGMSKEVFAPTPSQQESQNDVSRPTGADAVLADALETAQHIKVAPVIRNFERLSLLD